MSQTNRITTIEINYDAGRKLSTYTTKDLFKSSVSQMKFFTKSTYFSPFVTLMNLSQRSKLINWKFEELKRVHLSLISSRENTPSINNITYSPKEDNSLALIPGTIQIYHALGEEIIFHMRIVLDNLVQIISIESDIQGFEESKKIKYDSIGQLLKFSKKPEPVIQIILGSDDYEKDETKYLESINQTVNSLKHSVFHAETGVIYGEKHPTITSLGVERGNLGKGLFFYNHNAYHIMMGFQDCIERIFRNLEKWKTAVNTE